MRTTSSIIPAPRASFFRRTLWGALTCYGVGLLGLTGPLGLAGCGGGGSDGPVATFYVTESGEQKLAAIPWPSNLLIDDGGHLAVSTLPLDETNVTASLITDLRTEQDGFGVISGAYFPIGRYQTNAFGAVQADPEAGLVDAGTLTGNVHLLPLGCSDGASLPAEEVPLYVHLRASDSPQRIYARPERGVVLRERCTYAYVITRKVRTDKGALAPTEDLSALLDEATPASRLARAHTIFAPLRARLALPGSIATADIAVATVFTTHSLTSDYLAARQALVAAGKPKASVTYVYARTPTLVNEGSLDELLGVAAVEQPGTDNAGGVAHAGIEYVVQGSFETLDFLGGTSKNALGINITAPGFVEHEGAKLKVKGTITVPFTLVIPVGADLTKLPFAVVQHGLGRDRGWLVSVANTLALRGVASLLIDLPFHGGRSTSVDEQHEFGGGSGPDGFGESTADASYGFFDVTGNAAAGVPGLSPRAIRSHFFQSVNDIAQAFRLMAEGDLSAIGAREPRLATLAIDATREVYVGESFGAMIGTIVSALEPKLVATVLDVGGGGTIFPLLLNSAVYGPVFGTLLNGSLGTHAGDNDEPRDTDWGYNLGEMLLDVGDSLAFSPYVLAKQDWGASATAPDSPCHVLQLSAYQDESVPNPSNLALARGIGLSPMTLADGVAPDLSGWAGIEPVLGSLSGNSQGRTAAFVQFHDAAHGMISERAGEHSFDLSSGAPPFPRRTSPVAIANPIDRVHALVGAFIEAAIKGQTPVVK